MKKIENEEVVLHADKQKALSNFLNDFDFGSFFKNIFNSDSIFGSLVDDGIDKALVKKEIEENEDGL